MNKYYNIDNGLSLNKRELSYQNQEFYNKNISFNECLITHSRFYNCTFNNINFEDCAATGSKFERCSFNECNFNNADFEFCEIIDCYIDTRQIIGCSFNNTNFVKTKLINSIYTNCTFTGTFFEDCLINDINIVLSTLEGACFKNCEFQNLDWSNTNLEYVEFIRPNMNNVILSYYQVPYMFGILQYIANTSDDVKFKAADDIIEVDQYLKEDILEQLEYFKKCNKYYPISNIFLFGPHPDNDLAFEYLQKELTNLAMIRDYRGIKFCCKLIAASEVFSRKKLNKLYDCVTKIDISIDKDSAEMKCFSRNIGEIREILYQKTKQPKMNIILKTNIGIENSLKFATLINIIQNISKPNHTSEIISSITLSYNSPLIIDVCVEGRFDYFLKILQNFLYINGYSEETVNSCPIFKLFPENYDKKILQFDNNDFQIIDLQKKYLKKEGLSLEIIELNVNNYESINRIYDENFLIGTNE